MSYKRILVSVSMIAFVGALVVGATGAFFSDTETSTGNTFTAGAIDLTIGNDSYVTNEAGVLESSENTSWERGDLDDEVFFDFADLKPGDIGEDTISIQVDDNDAWACMATRITDTPENDQTEPEEEVDETDGENEGELQDALQFAFWVDDGDNVFEEGETLLPIDGHEGDTDGIATLQEIVDLHGDGESAVLQLADSDWNPFEDDQSDTPLEGEKEYHMAKAWCLGDLEPAPEDGNSDEGPLDQGTGFVCDGSEIGNETQTDGVQGDMEFFAVQSRNNGEFSCLNSEDYTPTWEGDQGEDVVFSFLDNDTDSPGRDDNQSGEEVPGAEEEDQPYVTWDINGDEIDFTFHNPTPWLFVFDVQVDEEDGDPRPGGLTSLEISEGPLAGEDFGETYQRVEVDGSSTSSVTQTFSGSDEIRVGLREGAEQKVYFDWLTFEAN